MTIVDLPMGSERVQPERWAALQQRGLGGDAVLLTVADAGPGVPDEDKERIFARFYQAEAGRAIPARGVGLGLTICHEVVMAHGGAIWVSDNEPHGSVFNVSASGCGEHAGRSADRQRCPQPPARRRDSRRGADSYRACRAALVARALHVPARRSSIATWTSDDGLTPLASSRPTRRCSTTSTRCMRPASCTARRNGRRSIRRSRAICCDGSSRVFLRANIATMRRVGWRCSIRSYSARRDVREARSANWRRRSKH